MIRCLHKSKSMNYKNIGRFNVACQRNNHRESNQKKTYLKKYNGNVTGGNLQYA